MFIVKALQESILILATNSYEQLLLIGSRLVISLVFGGITVSIAKSRGKDSVIGWFLLGFFLDVVGIIITLICCKTTTYSNENEDIYFITGEKRDD